MTSDNNNIDIQIRDRFIQVITRLVESRKISSKKQFAIDNGFEYANFRKIITQKKRFPTYPMMYVCSSRYGVDLNWLITGKNELFFTNVSH